MEKGANLVGASHFERSVFVRLVSHTESGASYLREPRFFGGEYENERNRPFAETTAAAVAD
jgi:hypothetical protein